MKFISNFLLTTDTTEATTTTTPVSVTTVVDTKISVSLDDVAQVTSPIWIARRIIVFCQNVTNLENEVVFLLFIRIFLGRYFYLISLSSKQSLRHKESKMVTTILQLFSIGIGTLLFISLLFS